MLTKWIHSGDLTFCSNFTFYNNVIYSLSIILKYLYYFQRLMNSYILYKTHKYSKTLIWTIFSSQFYATSGCGFWTLLLSNYWKCAPIFFKNCSSKEVLFYGIRYCPCFLELVLHTCRKLIQNFKFKASEKV